MLYITVKGGGIMKLAKFAMQLAALVLLLSSASVLAGGFGPGLKQVWGFSKGEAGFQPAEVCELINQDSVQTFSASEGWIRRLGWMALDTTHCPTDDGMMGLNGEAIFTSWYGDELRATYTAQTVLPPPVIVQEITFIITGGTGRYKAASGKLLSVVFIEAQPSFFVPWPLKFSFTGYVNY